jgi:PAS domain S-box-containing protein
MATQQDTQSGIVIDAVDLPIVVIGQDATIIYCNSAATRFFSVTASVLGKRLRHLQALDGVASDIEELCEHVIASGSAAQRELGLKDGSWFVARTAAYRETDGRIAGAVITFTNVTGLRASVEQSIYEREYTKTILNTVVDPLVVLDAELRVRTANRAFHWMFQVSRHDTKDKALSELGPGRWASPQLRERLQRCFSEPDDRMEPIEVYTALPVVGRRALSLRARRLPPAPRREELILLSIQDITDRKEAEETRARLSEIVDSSDDAIIGETLDGTITSWNRGAEQIFGYSAAEAEGKHISLIVPEDRRAEHDAVLARLRRGESGDHFQSVRQAKDGRWLDMSLTISAIRNAEGRVIGVSKIARDISDRVQAERSLRSEIAAMNRLQEMVGRLLVCTDIGAALNEVLDASMTLGSANMGIVQLFDAHSDALDVVAHRGLTDTWLQDFHAARADAGTPQRRALRIGQRVILDDVPTAEGHAVQCTPLFGRSGAALGVLSMYYRGAHHSSERDLRILDLYARQASDFIERINTEDELRAADRRKDEFLATLAHELRNPLAPVKAALELVRRKLGSNLFENQLTMMARQVANLERIVDDLLEVARITRGKIELRKKRVDLGDAVTNALESARTVIAERNHEVSVNLPAHRLIVEADPVRIEQVVTNVLTNAAKYTEPGGRIVVSVGRADANAEIRVRDTGIGISKEMLPRVFDIFEQGRRDLARSTGGLGIGLAIVKSLTELHGGTVVATSAGAGLGSEFVVRLPIALALDDQPIDEPAAWSAPAAEIAAIKRRVLVVDDNSDAREAFAELLRDLGHEVRTAADGPTGIRLAAESYADVIFLDIGLPGMDGYEVAREIRRRNIDSQLIALTGYSHEGARGMSKDAGFSQHLVKPPSFETIIGLLASAGAASRPLN